MRKPDSRDNAGARRSLTANRLMNDLRGCERPDYDRERDSLIETLSSAPGIVAIGVFGEVGHPGISDLDCLVIAEDGKLATAHDRYARWRNADPDREYIFWHPPVFVSQSMLTPLTYLHTLEGLSWYYGSALIYRDSQFDESLYLYYVWITFLLPIAVRIVKSTDVSLRKALLVLKNLQRSVSVLAGPDDKDTDALSIKNGQLRSQVLLELGEGTVSADSQAKAQTLFVDTLIALIRQIDQTVSSKAECHERKAKQCSARLIGRNLLLTEGGDTVATMNRWAHRLQVPHFLFNFILDEEKHPSGMEHQKTKYIEAFNTVNRMAQQEGVASPGIAPFGYKPTVSVMRRIGRRVVWQRNSLAASILSRRSLQLNKEGLSVCEFP